jgi:putative copper export protein
VGTAFLAFFIILPLALTLIRGGYIAKQMGRSDLKERFGRYQVLLKAIGVIPLVIVTFIIGVVLKGSSAHFQKPHEVTLLQQC